MPRLPTPGGDNGNWGDILNEYLSVSHDADGSIKDASISRAKLTDGIKDDIDAKLENITGYVSPGTNVTMTGLGTLASPYLISLTNAGGDVTGPNNVTANSLPKFSDTSGKSLTGSGLYVDDDGNLGIGTTSPLSNLHVAGELSTGDSVTTSNATRALNLAGTNAVMRIVRIHATAAPAVELLSRTTADGANVTSWDFYAEPSDGSFNIRDRTSTDRLRMRISSAGLVGVGTASPTHTLTLPSTSTGVAHYNTTDQTTNFERVLMAWSSNQFSIRVGTAGTGINRNLVIGSASTASFSSNGTMVFSGQTSNATGLTMASFTNIGSSAASGTSLGVNIQPVYNQSGTAAYTALQVNVTESSTGSGNKLLADFQVGGSSKTRIDNTGSHTLSMGAGITAYNTTDETTNFERFRQYWSGTTFTLTNDAGGTGIQRPLQLLVASGSLTLSASGLLSYAKDTTSAQSNFIIRGTATHSSGVSTSLSVTPTYAHSSTAGYTALQVNVTETSTGSGAKLLADFQVGASSKVAIDNTGKITWVGESGTNLYRNQVNQLKTDAVLIGNSGVFAGQGNGTARIGMSSAGVLEIGDGASTRDTNLYRSAAGILKTDSALIMGLNASQYNAARLSIGTGADANGGIGIRSNGTLATITNKSLTSNVATITTAAPHGFTVSRLVVISGVDSTFNGTYIISSVPSSTTFTYNRAAADVSSTASSGTAQANTQTGDMLTFSSFDGTTQAKFRASDSALLINTIAGLSTSSGSSPGSYISLSNTTGPVIVRQQTASGVVLSIQGVASQSGDLLQLVDSSASVLTRITASGKLDTNADSIRIRTSKTPASAIDTGNAGDIAWDANYVYVCVATNTWKRSAISSW